MTAPNVDLSPETVRALCKGDMKQLPSLWVHDNDVWRGDQLRVDTKNRIHMSRRVFENVVAPAIPVREGLWLRIDVQEFFIDLRPDQLQGDDYQKTVTTQAERRKLVLADDAARIPGEEDYGEDNHAAVRAPTRPGELPETPSERKAGSSGALFKRP